MFEGWQRADVISALALCMSGFALVASVAAARYTAIQTRLAKSKARDEEAAREPAIEPQLMPTRWLDWYRLELTIRNRLDIAIVCERVQLRKPRGTRIATFEQAGVVQPNVNGRKIWPVSPPAPGGFSDQIRLDRQLEAMGTRQQLIHNVMARDRLHIDDLLVFIPSTASSSARQDLEASLSVRRINDRDAFAESIIVTKIPPVSTKSET